MGADVDVLVIGAGPTGLALAIELHRWGLRCRLVDKLAAPARVTKASGVMPRTLEVLDGMGVGEPLRAAGLPLRGMTTWAEEHQKLMDLSFDGVDSPWPMVVSLPQYETERLLTERLTALGGRIDRCLDVVGLEDNDDGVRVTLERDGGGREDMTASYVVGSDGAHSFVRHHLGLTFEGAAYPEDFLVVHAGIDWDLPPDRIGMVLSRKGMIFGNPLPDGRWIMTGDLPQGTEHHHTPTVADVQALLDGRAPPGSKARDLVWASYFRIHHRQVNRYGKGRMFVAGDAAHVHSPAGGQGMNTGIQDAVNLGWKLALVVTGAADARILESYDAERRPVGKEVLKFANQVQVSSTIHHPVLQKLRDTVLVAAGQLEVVRHLTLGQMSEVAYTYRHGPLAAEHTDPGFHLHRDARHATFDDCLAFHHGPVAGDRAPDVPLGDGRLYSRLGGAAFHALLFEGTHRPLDAEPDLIRMARAMREAWGDRVRVSVVTPYAEPPEAVADDVDVVTDPFQAAHKRYGARGPCLYLVRPDGYVLYRCQSPDAARAARFATGAGIKLAVPA